MSVLLLVQKEPIGTANDLNAKEVVQRSQILEGKLVTKTSRELLKKPRRGCRQDNVVHIEQQVRSGSALMIDEQ